MSDARAMNSMTEQSRLGHALLTRWANAVRQGNPTAWPSITLLARVIEEGPHGAPTGIRPSSDLSAELAVVDGLVGHMGRDMKVAVLAYYQKWDTEKNVAAALGWPQGRLTLQLRMAREVVAIGVSASLKRLAS